MTGRGVETEEYFDFGTEEEYLDLLPVSLSTANSASSWFRHTTLSGSAMTRRRWPALLSREAVVVLKERRRE